MIIAEKNLASYAANSSNSKGRKFEEKIHPYRSEFQRDRERIIHCSSFRRLEYKTQVFINYEGDYYRTRLTHTIEVAQISRTIARALNLNEDLTESIALAHDLGHTPFGHAGERELNNLMKDYGGFEHNVQSLRVVDVLEKRYNDFEGLNLTYETREGIIKHSEIANSKLLQKYSEFNFSQNPSIEAQIIDIADEIAYNNHDVDDGIASGLLDEEEVQELKIWKIAMKELKGIKFKNKKIKRREIIRFIINMLVSDMIKFTQQNIAKNNIKSYSDVKNCKEKLTGFSKDIFTMNIELKKFLRSKLYNHYKVSRMTLKSQEVIKKIFNIYVNNPSVLPENYQKKIAEKTTQGIVRDYIAGMTDRYAIEEYYKLTDPLTGV